MYIAMLSSTVTQCKSIATPFTLQLIYRGIVLICMTPPSPNPSNASGALMHCYFSANILLEAYRNLPVTVAKYTIEADRIYLKPTS